MSVQSHLSQLERRHEALDRELKEALAHPASRAERVAELKRKKLLLKDEMNRLRNGSLSLH